MASKMYMSFTSSHACQSAIRSLRVQELFNSTIDFNKSDMSSMHDDGGEIPKHALPAQQANKPHVAKADKLKISLKCLNSQTSTAGITYCSFHPSWHCVKHEQVLLG
ncbi:hypothetical protein AMTRI_Chr13g82420 [Amborella trichopoda]